MAASAAGRRAGRIDGGCQLFGGPDVASLDWMQSPVLIQAMPTGLALVAEP